MVRAEELKSMVPLFPPIVVTPLSFVLADRLAFCRFYYRETLPAPARERWVQRWFVPLWPNAVRIEMAPVEADAVRIQPLTMTAPIRVNAEPGAQYGY
jgi:hypothetical protein